MQQPTFVKGFGDEPDAADSETRTHRTKREFARGADGCSIGLAMGRALDRLAQQINLQCTVVVSTFVLGQFPRTPRAKNTQLYVPKYQVQESVLGPRGMLALLSTQEKADPGDVSITC